MHPLVASIITACAVSLSVFVVFRCITGTAVTPFSRVEDYLGRMGEEKPDFEARIIRPLLSRISGLGRMIYPSHVIAGLDEYCLHAGRPFGLRGERLAGLKAFGGFSIGGAVFLLVPGPLRFFGACGMGALGYLLPGLWIQGKIRRRQNQARIQLADAMDLLVVSVEAGLGLDMAIGRVAERIKGPLGQAFSRALSEVSLGESRENALKGIARRLPLDEIRHFVNSLIQAEQLGVSLGGVLRSQADSIRRQRRLKAEEQARKAPVKMLFPLVMFIFPSLFVVILGPAVINIIRELSQQ